MTTVCSSCAVSLPAGARFCGQCGGPQAAAADLESSLDRYHLHVGHDYRSATRDAAGRLTAVYGLGANEGVIRGILHALPGYQAVEISRKPDVGHPGFRLRVDIIPR